MQCYPADDQQNEGGKGQPSQKAEFLRVVACHGDGPACLTIQRKPTWLMPVSIGCAWRAAGR
jgi:hypothetical protein